MDDARGSRLGDGFWSTFIFNAWESIKDLHDYEKETTEEYPHWVAFGVSSRWGYEVRFVVQKLKPNSVSVELKLEQEEQLDEQDIRRMMREVLDLVAQEFYGEE